MDEKNTEDRALQPDSLDIYLPIRAINPEKREVVLTATAEQLDSYETVIGYEGSKEAFANWKGNVREMHDPHKAVGRALVVDPHDDNKEIDVTLHISRGAEDTWQKVLDKTLTGGSIGARKGKWGKRTIDGKEVPFLERYELVELSLVDNPACPGANIKIVRNGAITEILDSEEEPETDLQRKGAPISKMNRDRLHGIINDSMQMCADNGCEDCSGAIVAKSTPSGERSIESEIRRQLSPVIARMQAILGSAAQRPQPTQISSKSDEAIQRHIEAMETRYESKLGEVRALLSDVKGLAERIAATPLPGGPVSTPVPVDKRLATSPVAGFNPNDDIAALQRAAQLGVFTNQESQVAAAAKLIALQHPGRG